MKKVTRRYSNVFVLSTGRCGTTTLANACSHMNNYTSGHETLSDQIGLSRLEYPKWHIESDNRLSWLLGRLGDKYGNSVLYVHLKRDPLETALSYAKREKGIMRAYQGGGIIMGQKKPNQLDVALDYVETVNKNIEAFLKDKKHKMDFELENSNRYFSDLWHIVRAEGSFEEALGEFEIRYNKS